MRAYIKSKTMTTIFTVVIMLFSLVSCSGRQNVYEKVQDYENNYYGDASLKENGSVLQSNLLTNEDFVVNNDSYSISLGEIYEELEIGENVISHHYADEKNAYDVIVYENFILSIFPNTDMGSSIFSINLITSTFETLRGVKVGDSASIVLEKYGVPDSESAEYYFYGYEGKFLIFYVDENDNVTGIKMEVV